jgi:2,5-diketo-D-gluconate reductase A
MGLVVIPKSSTPARLQENIDIFNFKLESDDLAKISKLDEGRRTGPDPNTFG